jgi:hypothetical protein
LSAKTAQTVTSVFQGLDKLNTTRRKLGDAQG